MTPEQKAAYIIAKAANMLTELEGMKALNQFRENQGCAQEYDSDAFFNLPAKYGLTENELANYCFS